MHKVDQGPPHKVVFCLKIIEQVMWLVFVFAYAQRNPTVNTSLDPLELRWLKIRTVSCGSAIRESHLLFPAEVGPHHDLIGRRCGGAALTRNQTYKMHARWLVTLAELIHDIMGWDASENQLK